MKKLLTAGAFSLMAITGTAQAAPVISFSGGPTAAMPANTSVFQNFESYAAGTMIGTNTYVKNATDSLGARPAYGSTGNFAAVFDGGSYDVSFGPTSVFSFVLGSLDTFNTLRLYYTDNTSTFYQGGAITNDASYNSGSRTDADTNGVVTYTVTSGPLISRAVFGSSGGNSFEFDNLAAAVPEPAMWGMMILGFGLAGTALRRRPSTKVRFA